MPEEINRLITDAISDLLFVTEKSGMENLKNEGVDDSKVHIVGHVMIESLINFSEKAAESTIMEQLNVEKNNYALITLHRPSNVDNEQVFTKLIEASGFFFSHHNGGSR